MSAKFMHVFTDENQELQKQIGCMTGIFQMFDRNHLLTGRHLTARGHKRLPSGRGLSNSSGDGAERKACSPRIAPEKNSCKSVYENQRVSMESSRTSFSSSSCSSFSSIECSKSTQQDLPVFQERSSKTSPKLKSSDNDTRPVNCEPRSDSQNASVQSTRQPLDFREVVKDSIYRDTRSLTVKTLAKEEVKSHVLKHRDSPRPAQFSKSMDGSYVIGINGKSRMPVGLDEPLRVLVKLKEVPWYISEADEPPRLSYEAKEASFKPLSREAPRFSYDGREIPRTSLDSREHIKSASKLRELPRLSLDSREGSLKSSNFGSTPNSVFRDLDRSINQVFAASNVQPELGSHKQPPSVVAKLMGLEAMPNSSLAAQDPKELAKTCIQKDRAPYGAQGSSKFILKSEDAAQDSKQDQLACSPRRSFKGPSSPRLNKPDSVMKPISNSRVPIETAPWGQAYRVREPQKATFGNQDTHLKQPPESVYSEIERRLKELEFRQSNKDLRALKQILDAMQAKGLLETKKDEERHSEVSVSKNHPNKIPIRNNQHLEPADVRNRQIAHPMRTLKKGNSNPKGYESPIVIMKPAKSVNRSGFSASSVIPLEGLPGLRKLRTPDTMDKKKALVSSRVAKDQTPKASSRELSNQHLLSTDENIIIKSEDNSSQKTRSRMIQGTSRPQQSSREDNGSSVKSPSSLSPRLKQKKHETERKLRPPRPSDSNKPQRISTNKQPSESVSPRGKLRRKSIKVQENDEQLRESSETWNLSQQGDEFSLRSDSNISLASQVDEEVTSGEQSADMNLAIIQQGSQRPLGKAANNASSILKQKAYSLSLKEEVSSMEPATVSPEKPSPISVLDASFYQDDLPPSPVKKNSDAFKDDTSQASSNQLNLMTVVPNASQPKLSSEINHKKLESIQNLVQKLSELSSSDDGARTTDHIASLCETQNPDHHYVSEILLASGLVLKDLSDGSMGLMPIQLHPSGHPINPDLFLVLEQTKSGWLSKPETIQESTLRPRPDPEKLHRKLVFDVVNEILIQKLEPTSQDTSISLSLQRKKLPRRFPSGQRLLKELCSEIDQLIAESSSVDSIEDRSIAGEDVLHKSEGWTEIGKEVPGVILEIERLIFKDLIDEFISGESAFGLKPKSSRRRRQLFSK